MSKQLWSEPIAAYEQRHAPRYALRFATNTLVGDTDLEAQILSISHTGILLEVPGQIAVGTNVNISLDGNDRIPAEVVWSDGMVSGCSFEKPLPKAVLSAVRLKGHVVGKEAFNFGVANASLMLADEDDRWPAIARIATFVAACTASWALVVFAALLIL